MRGVHPFCLVTMSMFEWKPWNFLKSGTMATWSKGSSRAAWRSASPFGDPGMLDISWDWGKKKINSILQPLNTTSFTKTFKTLTNQVSTKASRHPPLESGESSHAYEGLSAGLEVLGYQGSWLNWAHGVGLALDLAKQKKATFPSFWGRGFFPIWDLDFFVEEKNVYSFCQWQP